MHCPYFLCAVPYILCAVPFLSQLIQRWIYLSSLMVMLRQIIQMQQDNQDQTLSQSTRTRYHRAQRSDQLPHFLSFKHEYEHFLPPSKIQSVKAVYQHGICGRNRSGQTVVVDRIGSIKLQSLLKVLEEEQLVAYTNQRLLQLSEQTLRQNEQVVWVMDLSGKIMQLASKKMLEMVEKIVGSALTYFPNMLHKLVFVNTPMLFDTVWGKVAGLLPKHTQLKVVMIADQLENLYQFADMEVLPEFLGGTLSEEAFLYGRKAEDQHHQQQEASEDEIDISSLKQALGGLKIAASSVKSVLQTPLNTEADEK